MTDYNDGGPAFPHGNPMHGGDIGMSLRDWLAGQALSGLIMGYTHAYGSPTSRPDEVCQEAYGYADAMLKAREEFRALIEKEGKT